MNSGMDEELQEARRKSGPMGELFVRLKRLRQKAQYWEERFWELYDHHHQLSKRQTAHQPDELYYVVDLNRAGSGDVFLFWKPNNRGYTSVLDQAGKYTREQIEASPDYYNDGMEAIAVPCAEVESHAVRVVGISSEVCQAFGAARCKCQPKRPKRNKLKEKGYVA